MTARRETAPPARAGRPPVLRRRRRPFGRGLRPQHRSVMWLALGAVVITAAIVAWPGIVPVTTLMVPLLLGSLILGPRQLPWFVIAVMVLLIAGLVRQDPISARTVLAVATIYLLCFIVLVTSFRRSQLGVAGFLGESMLVDLRDRILNQGGVPDLPDEWLVESVLRSAGGTPFAGDFVVSTRPRRSCRLELVLVDVSGKGEQAGTRALLLSGAFGGLLGALDTQEFLPAANDYLLRQEWEEGFATAVHLSLDLTTGEFEVRFAGHPPPAQLAAGSGRWVVHEAEGPVLGLIEDADFGCVRGLLRRGDTLLLYTDGMVETARRDISLGIDRMLGRAEDLLRSGIEGGAARLVESLGSEQDDRALVLVHRR
jgi:hypothetical protein